MLLFVAIVVAILGALILYASIQTEDCEISRSIKISASPERIFPFINDIRAMNEWNPFVKADPNIRLAYSGPAEGVGATNDFSGNGKVGTGRAEIVESIHPAKVAMTIRMDRPMKCENRAEFTIAPQSTGAEVTWTLTGRRPFIGKLMSIFFRMERVVGGAFEAGLADLKAKAEA